MCSKKAGCLLPKAGGLFQKDDRLFRKAREVFQSLLQPFLSPYFPLTHLCGLTLFFGSFFYLSFIYFTFVLSPIYTILNDDTN